MVRILPVRLPGNTSLALSKQHQNTFSISSFVHPLKFRFKTNALHRSNKKDVPPASPPNDSLSFKTKSHRFYCFTPRALSLGSELFHEDVPFTVDHARYIWGDLNWENHRHKWRHLRFTFSLLTSRVFGSSFPPIVFCMTFFSTLVVLWNYSVVFKLLPPFLPLLRLDIFPFTIVFSVISFLLTFRINTSYGRFDEVSKMCASIVTRIREISRCTLSYMSTKKEDLNARRKSNQILRHLQALPLTFKHLFLQVGSLEKDLKRNTTLTQNEIDNIMQAHHKPNYVLHMISECIYTSELHPFQKNCMDTHLTGLMDEIGGSERIFTTPIPLYYTRLTSQLLMAWHFFLPLGLWDACQWGTVFVFFLIATVLFRIEEVGLSIEQPLTFFPLMEMAKNVNMDISGMIRQQDSARESVVHIDPQPNNLDPYSVCTMLKNLTPSFFLIWSLPANSASKKSKRKIHAISRSKTGTLTKAPYVQINSNQANSSRMTIRDHKFERSNRLIRVNQFNPSIQSENCDLDECFVLK